MGNVDETLGDDSATLNETRSLEGTTLGPYKIERLLGEGAMGEVFLANHVALGRPVALKTLKPAVAADRALTERFFAEARAVNIIRHENIVECTDLVNDPAGRSYIVMELLEGKTLGGAIRDAGRIPVRRAARIAAQIADAIGAAHDKGIVHRDLKPENVYLIRRAGSSDYVKVLDFGIARLRPELGGVSATQSGALIGTPAYMSPEQVRGEKVGSSADIYALGVILFNMLTGRMPFEATSMSMMLVAQLQETPARVDKLVPDVPVAMADLVARALAKDAAGRPADMATFRREVLEIAGLPAETHASMIDSSPSLPRTSGQSSAVGSAAVSGLDPTLPPGAIAAIGQSSISASAGEIGSPPRPKRGYLFIGAGVVVAGCAVAMFTVGPWGKSGSPDSGPTTNPPAEPQTITLGAAKPRENPTTPAPDDKQAQFDAERKPEKIVDALGIKPGAWVADIGAGPGFLTVHLARAVRPGGKIVATDVDDAVLSRLETRLETAGLADLVEPRVVEPDSPGLEKDTYDAILLAEVDHQFADPVAWLEAAIPALKADGRIVISNRIHHATRSMAAAIKAGLRLESESTPVPTHFIAVYVAKRSARVEPPPRPDLPQTTRVKDRYSCAPMGKPKWGVGCSCGDGYVSKLDDQKVHVCVKAAPPKPDPVKTEAEQPKGDRTKTLVDPFKKKKPPDSPPMYE